MCCWAFARDVTVIVYVLILPVSLLVPKRLTVTKDGEAIAV
jgi:hypothetical protein